MRRSHEDLNRRKAVMGFRDGGGTWYGLDNAAIIMPAVSGSVETYLFRVSATLARPVVLPALQAALDRVARRFPYFVVELRKGVFWHHLVPHPGRPLVVADSISPCQGFDMHRRGTLLIRVRARERGIACEFSHILTDGTGGLRFLKNLLVEYFRALSPGDPELSREALAADPDLLDMDEDPHPEETEDAYNRNYPRGFPFPPHESPAWHLPGPLQQRGRYRTTVGILSLPLVSAKAKEYGVSLTEFLVAVYFDALQALWLADPSPRRRGRLAIEVPVNMRNLIPTKTNRNFSLFVHPELDMRLGAREFPEIAAKVHHQLRHEIDLKHMQRHIARNVRGGRALYIRILPLVLKAPLMRLLYSYYGMNKISGVLSNMGAVRLPEAVAKGIESFGLVLGPTKTLKTGASVLSFRGELRICFSSLARPRDLEGQFFSRLEALGIPVRVECNLPRE